jgi:hypothetical protein
MPRGNMDSDIVDFRLLSSHSLWSLFERRSCNGGVIAYAVLSKAKKIGCLCGSSLAKRKADRLKQADHWNEFCEKTCNLLWAQRFAFSIASHRSSFQGRLNASWSTDPATLQQQCLASNSVNDIARIASLAVDTRSAELLDQVIYCSKDCRASIIEDLWAILKRDFLCNSFWAPSHQYSFNDEVSRIIPVSACSVDIGTASLRELWSTIVSYLSGIFSGRDYAPSLDPQTIWVSHICKSGIPASHHAISMWIFLLWTTNTTSSFLDCAVKRPRSGSCSTAGECGAVSIPNATSLERRIDAMLMLRSKGLINKSEFERMRQRFIKSIQEEI